VFIIVTKKIEKENPKKKPCITCSKEKYIDRNYYVSYSQLNADGRISVCKTCLGNMFDIDNPHESINSIMRQIDKPYVSHLVDTSIEESPTNVLGKYMKNIGMRQYQDMTWNDSQVKTEKINLNENTNTRNASDYQLTDEFVDKWGFGYTQDEYRQFERKYNLLKNNYQEKTAMHTEALLTYVRYRVKEELATAQGDSKAAKEWGTLAKDAATAAKINPSQLSKSDLSDGLDTFGQLVRTVEQAVDIIPILPKFKEKPQDRADFTIWCYVNYVRDLKGLPPAEYKEIYEFYEVRKKAYEDAANQGDEDGIS
jgi:hypothetical protein